MTIVRIKSPKNNTLTDFAEEKLAALAEAGRRRVLHETATLDGVSVSRNGKNYINFSSNDYLGLAGDARIVAAAEAGLKELGAGASRLVTGNHLYYRDLESRLSTYLHREAALVCGSGYLANVGVIPALVGKGDLILGDKLMHACLIDGARLSDASFHRYRHNDMDSLATLLKKHRADHRHCLILTESIFSMDGDKANIKEIKSLCDRFNAWLLVDHAHGLGVMETPSEPDILVGTLSKSAGAYGGYVAGSNTLMEYLKTATRSMMFSTALPPTVIAGAAKAIKVMSEETWRSENALANARYFSSLMKLPKPESTIVPIILGSEQLALAAAAYLEEQGILCVAIRPPTVPEGTSRLRISFSALHTKEHSEKLAQAVQTFLSKAQVACAS